MKPNYLLTISAGVATMLMMSCSDDEFPTSCRLNEVEQDGAVIFKAEYDGANRLERLITYDEVTQIIDTDFRIYRNGTAIDSAYAYDESNVLIAKIRMIYNIDDQLARIDNFTDPDVDGTFTLEDYYEFLYNGADEITTITRYDENDVEEDQFDITWNNGNVVEYQNNTVRVEFAHDNKLNLYTGVGKDALFLAPELLPLILSENNTTRIEVFDLLNVSQLVTEVTYQYNDDNLPTQSTFSASNDPQDQVNNYSYTCD